MAITVTPRGQNANVTSALTITMSPSGNFAATSWAILSVGANNADLLGAPFTVFTVTDSLGNTWNQETRISYDPGAANDGFDGAQFVCAQNVAPLTTATVITVTFSALTTNKSIILDEIIPSAGLVLSLGTTGMNTAGAGTAPDMLTSSITSGSCLHCAVVMEYGVDGGAEPMVVTWDTDTTRGSWQAAPGHILNTSGSGATGITTGTQYKIVNALGMQTWNLVFNASCDSRMGWVEIKEAAAGGGGGQSPRGTSLRRSLSLC